jgi:Ca2+/Na+ antiporter
MTLPPGPWPQHPQGVPPPNPRPIRGSRVAIGIGAAIGAHVLSIALGIGIGALGIGFGALFTASDHLGAALAAITIGQLLVFVGCLAVGIVLLARGDRGIGLGLLIGWAVGVIVLPVVGFSVCVAVFSGAMG